ncbi:uncharacterized protein Bfra_007516 [Botrytis fragariae]|uniref:Hydrophobin n=1 Tax=Botrytis fragariae TaxID=1964551 RepID=A0A8H6EDJ3_9HELO|nr:uncharacterized protein Bfra_007516 [Botrytis fragariae]KAF5868319.1 hypothetical protein Bfra_007516 [Botrytis fragariae]
MISSPSPSHLQHPSPPSSSLTSLLDTLINITITASTLNSAPPAALTTTTHSAACTDVNQGALVCCPSILDGDQPVVVAAARMFGFVLNGNSVNGMGCEFLDFWGLYMCIWYVSFVFWVFLPINSAAGSMDLCCGFVEMRKLVGV